MALRRGSTLRGASLPDDEGTWIEWTFTEAGAVAYKQPGHKLISNDEATALMASNPGINERTLRENAKLGTTLTDMNPDDGIDLPEQAGKEMGGGEGFAGYDPSQYVTDGGQGASDFSGYETEEDLYKAQMRYPDAWGVFAPNGKPGENYNNVILDVRTKGASRGLLPGSLKDEQDFVALQEAIWSMPSRELASLQKKLWLSGYYGDEAIMSGIQPRLGIADTATTDAWQTLLSEGLQNLGERSLEDLLTSRLKAYKRVHKEAAMANAAGKTEVRQLSDERISVTDPATVTLAAQDFAQKSLGRRLSAEEVGAIVATVGSEEVGQQRAIAARNRAQELAAIQAEYGYTASNVPDVDVILGGGPDASSIGVGHSLAGDFGLTVTSDFRSPEANTIGGGAVVTPGEDTVLEDGTVVPGTPTVSTPTRDPSHQYGLGFDAVGHPDDMKRFERWAKASDLIETVELRNSEHGETAHLHFTLKEGAEIPAQVANGTWQSGAPDRSRQLSAFLATVKNPGGDMAYGLNLGAIVGQQAPIAGRDTNVVSVSSGNANGVPIPIGDPQSGSYQFPKETPVGAYGIPKRVMKNYADQLRVKPGTKSGQQLIAKAYATDLYNQYQDWRLVAVAWQFGTALADKMKDTNPNLTSGTAWTKAMPAVNRYLETTMKEWNMRYRARSGAIEISEGMPIVDTPRAVQAEQHIGGKGRSRPANRTAQLPEDGNGDGMPDNLNPALAPLFGQSGNEGNAGLGPTPNLNPSLNPLFGKGDNKSAAAEARDEITGGDDRMDQLFESVLGGSSEAVGPNVVLTGGNIDEVVNVDPVSRAQLEIIDRNNTEFYAHEGAMMYEQFRKLISDPNAMV